MSWNGFCWWSQFHGSLVSSLHYTAQSRQVLVLLPSRPLSQLLPLQPWLLTVQNINVDLGSDDGVGVELRLLGVALTGNGLQPLHWSNRFVYVELDIHLRNKNVFYKEISIDESRKERDVESLTIACCHVKPTWCDKFTCLCDWLLHLQSTTQQIGIQHGNDTEAIVRRTILRDGILYFLI